MLVTFSCEEYENITMFGDVAKKLIILMGHSATIPGAIVAEDVPSALANLKPGIAQEGSHWQEQQEDDDEEPAVSLNNRAIPIINMLEAAARKKCNIMWK